MENMFNNRDFEQFVKQNADQYRMFPSEKVWNGIHNTLHTRRRWYGIGLAFLLLTTATVTAVMLSPSGKKQQQAYRPFAAARQVEQEAAQKTDMLIQSAKPANERTAFITTTERFRKDIFIPSAATTITVTDDPEEYGGEMTEETSEPVLNPVVLTQPEYISKPVALTTGNRPATAVAAAKPVSTTDPVTTNRAKTDHNLVISFAKDDKNKYDEPAKEREIVLNLDKNLSPFTIESVVNSYRHSRLKKKMSWQVFFTPTVSYRRLGENKEFLNASRPYTASPTYQTTDVNSVVTHKPDLGLQFGFATGYPLLKRVKIITGLQINVSKYDIRAFTYPSEVATIALSTAAGGANTVSTFTNYRNSGSSARADWLRNLYISASVPVGLEYKIIGNKKSYAGVAATVQPTYILSNRAYLLSTDYKNYAEVPSLVRKWNVNTGFEIFAGYTTGKLNWRISPQVRYQTLSSFQAKYPVKEHLFDFGVKLGLMLRN